MNADEIARALREMLPPKVDYAKLVCAEGLAHGRCYVWDDPEPYIISAAADLIESLRANLAESQRRERAAVEFIKYLDRNYSGYMAEDERFAEWRGPQETGKGGPK